MRYYSTRDLRQEWPVNLDAALSAGLAADGGLYVPERLPRAAPADFADCDGLPAIAERLLAPYFVGSTLASELAAICREALDLPLPLLPLPADEYPGRAWLLELFHGPTAAFKDYAARFLAACLQRLRSQDDPIRTVLVATSGDTGAAVAAAFHRRPGFRVLILYPDGRVSPRQAHQLGAFGDNVRAFRVDGSFDDCQRLVKAALSDRALAARYALTSANSISLGRLLPQMAYHAAAALALDDDPQRSSSAPPAVIVPTGNLGNALAAILVREMGLPLGSVHLAINANRTLADYFASGRYQGRASIATLANAMDVGDPSNFERLQHVFKGRDLRHSDIHAQSVDDDSIRARIREGAARYGQILCPHTACAVEVYERCRRADANGDFLLVATAHPAKFDSIVEALVGHPVPPPPALAELLRRTSSATTMRADDDALRACLESW